MSCDDLPEDLKALWKEAGTDRVMFSSGQLHREAERMQATRRRSYLTLGIASCSAVASYVFIGFYFDNALTRAGSSLSILVFGYLLAHAQRERARAASGLGETGAVRFYRAELERQREWHRRVAWWLMVLTLPLSLVGLGVAQVIGRMWPWAAPVLWCWAAFLLGVLGVWGPAKHFRLARQYQERMDALDAGAAGTE